MTCEECLHSDDSWGNYESEDIIWCHFHQERVTKGTTCNEEEKK